MKADSTAADAEATSLLASVGLAGGGNSQTSTATVSGNVEAYIGAQQDATTTSSDPTQINVPGNVGVTASSEDPTARAEADGGAGSVLISVTLVQATATLSGSVLAYVGYLGSPTGMAPASFKAGNLDVEASVTGEKATTSLNPAPSAWSAAGPVRTARPVSSAAISGTVSAYLEPAGASPAADRASRWT